MQFYYAEEPASPLDFDEGEGEHAVAATASLAPAINRAGAFREEGEEEELHASVNSAFCLPACLPARPAACLTGIPNQVDDALSPAPVRARQRRGAIPVPPAVVDGAPLIQTALERQVECGQTIVRSEAVFVCSAERPISGSHDYTPEIHSSRKAFR